MTTWSPGETAGVIDPVGIENGRSSPNKRSTINAPMHNPGIKDKPISKLSRRFHELR
jgi:hypothetical protein